MFENQYNNRYKRWIFIHILIYFYMWTTGYIRLVTPIIAQHFLPIIIIFVQFLLYSIYYRRQYCNRNSFRLLIFDEITCFRGPKWRKVWFYKLFVYLYVHLFSLYHRKCMKLCTDWTKFHIHRIWPSGSS